MQNSSARAQFHLAPVLEHSWCSNKTCNSVVELLSAPTLCLATCTSDEGHHPCRSISTTMQVCSPIYIRKLLVLKMLTLTTKLWHCIGGTSYLQPEGKDKLLQLGWTQQPLVTPSSGQGAAWADLCAAWSISLPALLVCILWDGWEWIPPRKGFHYLI